MIKITIPGRPISKSNFKLHNIHGQAWMPSKGKHSKYLAYENMIAGYINQQYQGEQIEEEFLPSFPRVKNFAMGIRTESVKGQCIIEIRDDEKTLYELNWKLAELADTEYVQVPVDWNFKRDSNYRIVIHLHYVYIVALTH